MTTINLVELRHYEFKDVYCYCINFPGGLFTVKLERDPFTTNDYENKFWELYYATYAGEMFAKAAQQFCYWVPDINGSEPFIFHGVFTDMELLSDTIFIMLQVYLGGCMAEDLIDEVCDFYANGWNYNPEPACAGLFQLANQHQLKCYS